MAISIPKVVIDTNIYISAIFWGGKPRKVIELGRSGHIWIFTSVEIEKEIEEKLRLKFKLDTRMTTNLSNVRYYVGPIILFRVTSTY